VRTRSAEAWVSVRAARDVTIKVFLVSILSSNFGGGKGERNLTDLTVNDR
jgi:hypothetical protein